MSKYEKSEKRFNFIDVLIILSILLIVAAFIFRTQWITFLNNNESKRNCVIHFQSEGVPEESIEYIKEGMKLSWLERGQTLGTLGKTTVAPDVIYIEGAITGKYETVGDPKNYTLSGTINASVVYDEEKGCFIGGTSFLAPGMVITVYSENVQFELTVTGINY